MLGLAYYFGYAAFSSGHIIDEMIKEYLEKHDKDSNHNDFSHDKY
ncbi:MAG: hypothetical protein V3U71_06645 [Cocleimonas sp.]